ncbi:MAG: Coenzyme F420 hydrogenase/dehydrogenase, beta subunit C-terminal domain [Candidatus Undinarchaeales archaeon]|nr:Coenzyme F420 hydrogenase/dehydrogenase, beta subunit C-terminal domain [Candidatus Undinarchaeales archaeon]MDP7494146.1 Coenzyme F420 hydrogenase/dehydrogenase, beta subunit C-terminal domain [Candidatus Undinarchaeales archaeon]
MSFEYLQGEVIGKGQCVACGACVGICPKKDMIEMGPDAPRLVDECIECGLCYKACPRVTPWTWSGDAPLGPMLAAYAARTTDLELRGQAQDGGVASALASLALERGAGVLAIDRDGWRAVPRRFTDRLPPGGSVFCHVPLLHLLFGTKEPTWVIGLPCHTRGARTLAELPATRRRIGLIIGLLCSKTFDHDAMWALLEEQGAEQETAERMAITRGRMVVEGKSTVDVHVKELAPVARGCFKICDDFAARDADIALGGVDSPDGWTTVIVRTEAGKEAFDALVSSGAVDVVPITDLPIATKLTTLKAKKACNDP